MSWKSNALTTHPVYDPATLSSMTTVLETSEPSQSSKVFPPYDWPLKDVKSSAAGVSVDVRLNRTSYSSNDSVSGKFFIICPKKCPKLKIGKIEIRLFGFEETYPGKKHSQTRLFFSKLASIQNQRLPPSSFVFPGSPDEDGMWLSRPGSNSIDFSIPFTGNKEGIETLKGVEGPLPSSVWKTNYGGIRYVLACIVHFKTGSKIRTPLAVYADIPFIEHYTSVLSPAWFKPIRAHSSATIEIPSGLFYNRKRGIVKLSVSPATQETESLNESGIWTSGNTGYIHVVIDNATPRQLKEIQMTLVRRFKTFEEKKDEAGRQVPQPVELIRENVITKRMIPTKPKIKSGRVIFSPPKASERLERDSRWTIAPGESRSIMLELDIPGDMNSIRFGTLVDVSFVVSVSAIMSGGKRVTVEAPVTILSTKALMSASPWLEFKNTDDCAITAQIDAHVPLDIVPTNPAALTKDETLVDTILGTAQAAESVQTNSLDSQELKSLSLRAESTKMGPGSRASTIGSRRIDSIRFKERTRMSATSTFDKNTPKGTLIPIPPPQPIMLEEDQAPVKNIESEIDRFFESVF